MGGQLIRSFVARRSEGGGDYTTPGGLVIASDGFKNFGGSRTRGKFSVQVKTVTTAAASGGALIPPDRRVDPVLMPQQRLTVRPDRAGPDHVILD